MFHPSAPPATQYAIPAYAGPWTRVQAGHLLRRAVFGPTATEIRQATTRGLQTTLNQLLTDTFASPRPLNYSFTGDPAIPVGTTWVNKPYGPNDNENYRNTSLSAWFVHNKIDGPVNLREKMHLLWINHFGLRSVIDHRTEHQYFELLYTHGMRNFRALLEAVTVNPAMLQFLDGQTNISDNPNENYAREFLELFTIQKGEQVGESDYTNYTEQDVAELARCFTGWRNNNFVFSSDNTRVASYFDADKHDAGTKTLSPRLDSVVIANGGANEYKRVIDILLRKEQTARALCREFYRFFVYSEISEEVEATIIAPLAGLLMAERYDVKPVLRALLGSQHFFDVARRGAIIKNPYEYVLGISRTLLGYGHLNLNLRQYYIMGAKLQDYATRMNMDFKNLPTVSGWRAYYQGPDYSRHWATPVTLQRRQETLNEIVTGSLHAENFLLQIDWFAALQSFEEPGELDALIGELLNTFLPRQLTEGQIAELKQVVLQGLPDNTWRVLYAQTLSNPNDEDSRRLLTSRFQQLVRAVLELPEYHLI